MQISEAESAVMEVLWRRAPGKATGVILPLAIQSSLMPVDFTTPAQRWSSLPM